MQLKITPNTEAALFLRGKAAAKPDVFGRMLPDLRGLSLTVAKVTDFDVLRDLRKKIAELPEGGNWREIRKSIAAEISPYMDEADPETGLVNGPSAAAKAKAELVLRTVGFQAYSAARYLQQVSTKDALPYWQYLTVGDQNVRSAHAALDGKVFPADDPFWQTHYPPWDFGCRCVVAALPQADAEEMIAEDAEKDPADRRVLDEEQLAKARKGELSRGLYGKADIRPPEEMAPADEKLAAYRWRPGDLKPNLERLLERYEPEVFDAFEASMRKDQVQIERGQVVTVWDWVGGNV